MKPIRHIFCCISFLSFAFAASLQAQDGDDAGNNSGVPASQESQTPGPSGQTDFQTDLFTGRFGYTIPFVLAPGRHGSTPSVELIYNSANPNGMCGVGWDIDLGYIERETRFGMPVQWSAGLPLPDYDDTKGFTMSFNRKNSALVQVSGGTYAAQIQSDFVNFQYQSSANQWVATDKSGTQYYFGESAASRMINPKSGWSQSASSGTFRWALDKIQTVEGDIATISYTTISNYLYPNTLSYNAHTSGLAASCFVYFSLAHRPDTNISCKSGYRVDQTMLISGILHTAGGQTVWSNSLTYVTSPSTLRSLLHSVTRYGADLSSTLPPVTFNYSQQNYGFQTATNWGPLDMPAGATGNPNYYGLSGTVSSPGGSFELVDVDGDGFPDRIIQGPESPFNQWYVQHNTGTGFGPLTAWTLGSQSYDGFSTSSTPSWYALAGNSHARLLDINGDAIPDIVFDPLPFFYDTDADPSSYNYFFVQTNNGSSFGSPGLNWTNVNDQEFVSGQTGVFQAVEKVGYVMMIDMNGDGLLDRVMIKTQAPYNGYEVQFNTGSGFPNTNFFAFQQQIAGNTNYANWAGLSGSGGQTNIRLMDINGDGLPDQVMLVATSNGLASPAQQTYFVVALGNGYGFEPPMIWPGVDPLTNFPCGGGDFEGYMDLGDDQSVALRDVNGDGLPDRVLAVPCGGVYTNFFVQINTGSGFGPVTNWGSIDTQGQPGDPPAGAVTSLASMLMDMNGDGLVDRVSAVFVPTASSNYFVVELSKGPFPDLLTNVANGLGGTVAVTWEPSTQYNNLDSVGNQRLPFPLYTVSSLAVGDGLAQTNTTTYGYTGGLWNFALRQFDGFAQTTNVDPMGRTRIHWFHQAGGRDNSAFGEYEDSPSAIGKVGMEYRQDTIGSNGNPYQLVLNQVNETVLTGGQHFAYVTTNIEIDYPATSSAYRATARQYYYNLSNGNLTNETDCGAVGSVNTQTEGFTNIPGDTVYHLTQFATLSNTNIVDRPGTITVSTDSAGNNILRQETFTYDTTTAANLLTKNYLICPGTYRTTNYTYNGYNNVQTETDPVGIVTTTTYDSASETFPTQTVISDPQTNRTFTSTFQYDPRSGQLLASTDPAGLVTTNAYDAFLRILETQVSTTPNGSASEWIDNYTYQQGVSNGLPDNAVFHYEHDDVNANGYETVSYRDGVDRLVQVRKEAEGNNGFRVVNTAYDQRGNIIFETDPVFSSGDSFVTLSGTFLGTLYGYDPIGRLTIVTPGENGTLSSGLLTSSSATGGDSGSPVAASTNAYYNGTDPWTYVVSDATGKIHQYTMDAYGRTNQIVEVTTSGGNFTTTLGYNLAGDLTNLTDNAGNQIQYAYNLIGEKVAMADPDMGVWQYQRDVAGRLRKQIDGDNQTVEFNYDALGRLQTRQVYDLKTNFIYGVTNIYDTSDDPNFTVYPGQLYKTIDSEGFSKNGYDVRGRKIKTARYLSKNGNTYTNQYTYDDMDRVRSIVYPSNGPTITNIYDTGANLSQVQKVGGSGTTFYQATSFTPLDQIAGITYGNGVTATYSYYGNSKRLQSAVTSGGLQNLSYTYDQVADILSISDGIGAYSGSASAAISSVSYDDLHRLLSFTRPSTGQSVSFTYDTVGNMTTNSENGSGAYTYGPSAGLLPHAIRTANGLNYAYDLCGNMLSRGGQQLVYNAENRLIAVVSSNQVTTFGYDGSGARLWKQGSPTNTLQVWIGGNYEEKDGKILFHISTGDRLVCTFDASNTVFEYYHPDHLHSAEILSSSSGGLYQHYEYTAYGISRYTYSTTAFPISRRYTSQVLDEETGLYYYGARYYDPVIGRFVQPDTLIPNQFDPRSYDRYAYGMDNPLRYVDPSGHGPIDDALLNTGTIKACYKLMTMPDSTGWKWVEVPVGIAGMAAGIADAGFNALTLGGKGAVTGTVKEAVKVGAEGIAKTAGKEVLEGAAKETAKVGEAAVGAAAADTAAGTTAESKTYQTYTKPNRETGEVYSGRTSGTGTPVENVANRDVGHPMNKQGFGPAELDKSSSNPKAIRGREQQLIEANGGAKSQGGTSGNKINGISPNNAELNNYLDAANEEFGELIPQ